jgi:aspartate/methionine/tyrosine aminotransferase
VIHLEVGEPDFPTPALMIEAGMRALQTAEVKYTAAAGLPELRELIAEFYQTRYGLRISSERIFVTPGASGALMLALALLVNAGDEVLLPDPCYPCNRNFIRLFGGKPLLIPVDGSIDYQLNTALLKQYWTPTTRGTMIASPSNPTGTMIADKELRAIAAFCQQRNAWLISDEIYHGLNYQQQVRTALQFSNDALVINSFSKYFGMTGWRLGWLVVPKELMDSALKLSQNLFISAPGISQAAALYAFHQENIAELERRRDCFEQRRDFLYEALAGLGFVLHNRPQGAFYLYADCQNFTDDSAAFALKLLETQGVAVTPGCDFGDYQANTHLRFAYTTDVKHLEQAVERIALFLARN